MKKPDFEAFVQPPYAIRAPKRQTLPLVVVSAHSGDRYPARFLKSASADLALLRRSEDWAMDRIAAAAPLLGAPLLAATFPRSYLDANREPFELDPEMYRTPLPDYINRRSARVRAGFGTIHRRAVDGTEIYGEPLDFAEALFRIDRFYLPFHAALERLIRGTLRRFGVCILVDCHSMPSGVEGPESRLEFILGDLDGQSCAPAVSGRAERALRAGGWAVRRNDPYPGAFITRHYGAPAFGVHAIQLEVNRALYMDEERLAPSDGFPGVAQAVAGLIRALGGLDLPPSRRRGTLPAGHFAALDSGGPGG